ncbi:hypothetical protein KUTeg_002968 [Tegillarca granosa]|uniref:TGS domain-containing protein n=1 Tax=Tegillarca granosa TaxID=220873 RepID=A0ABQ9FPL5_TEGGR|nr:hypothetical protein KUTeg_002968 [Tegillarca granosa]
MKTKAKQKYVYIKATEYHLGLLKAKLAKYRQQLLEPTGKSGQKSTLLNTLTSTHSESASYEFTTLTCIPGVIESLVLAFWDCLVSASVCYDYAVRELLTEELESVGIRLNKKKPNIYFKQKKGGGLSFNATCQLTKCNEKMVQMILHEYSILDMILYNHIEFKCIVYNKIDQISLEEVDRLARLPNSVVVSCNMKLNLDYLLDSVWEYLALVRVYTKKRGERPDFEGGLILRKGCTVEHVCHQVHRTIVNTFKYALVWGRSVKYSPQRVGLSHTMQHDDVIQIVKK